LIILALSDIHLAFASTFQMAIKQVLFVALCERIKPFNFICGFLFLQPAKEAVVLFLPKGAVKHSLNDHIIERKSGFCCLHSLSLSPNFHEVKIGFRKLGNCS